MEITINASKLVKPSTPTPSTLRNYNMSFFDEQQPDFNIPLVLYYSASEKAQNNKDASIFNHLETSLSKTLSGFYPLAGRYIRHDSSIDCSDQGALYVEAKANYKLTEFLGLAWELKFKMLHDFQPWGIYDACEIHDPLLSVKVTAFECGSIAIGICVSHKVGDMSTMSTFIDEWAATNRLKLDNAFELQKHFPAFGVPQRYPKRGLHHRTITPKSSMGVNIPMQTFLFNGDALSKMRELLTFKDSMSHRPSKVLLIESLFWKAFMRIDKLNNNEKLSTLSQAVNLRNKVVPKLPHHLCGNFFSLANSRIEPHEGHNINLQGFFSLLGDSIEKVVSNYAKETPGEEEYEVLVNPYLEFYKYNTSDDVNAYLISSWCRFAFNKADFGWGKPVWKSTGKFEYQNLVLMMDDQEGDGVEAWVIYLDEKRMRQLEQDPDIQTYAL